MDPILLSDVNTADEDPSLEESTVGINEAPAGAATAAATVAATAAATAAAAVDVSTEASLDVRLLERSRVVKKAAPLHLPASGEVLVPEEIGQTLLRSLKTADEVAIDRCLSLLEFLFKQQPEEVKQRLNTIPDESGQNALHIAAFSSSAGTIRRLLELGADPLLAEPVLGHLPVHRACTRRMGAGPVVLALISGTVGESTVLSQDEAEYIPFWTAAEERNISAMEALLTLLPDAQLTYKNSARKGDTVLHHVARRKELNMIKTLIMSGAAINTANLDGQTVTHIVAATGQVDALEFLLSQRHAQQLDLDLTDSVRHPKQLPM
ncbi:hypothetical protein BV898_12911 [Hypsibius exemplaris]|uniref:Uncharacterized protein n=1 Tax=Hypsibius exemplaris TaxID=2072580 RepID=A0A1W0WC52_HYPEX|nr:hypothetical protein BV898_12911 [Hypsibius exemplaris]